MSSLKETILVVDDDFNLIKALTLRLRMWGYGVATAFNGAEALLLADLVKPDLIITDLWMPVGTGFSLAFRLKRDGGNIPIIFLSASKQANLKAMVKDFESVAFLEKPYEPESLQKAISSALHPEMIASN